VVTCTNYILNWALTRAMRDVTSLKKWSGRKPSIGYLRTFILIALTHISNDEQRKLDPKSHPCIMVSYLEESKAYPFFDPTK
jgi:hypothetical protein